MMMVVKRQQYVLLEEEEIRSVKRRLSSDLSVCRSHLSVSLSLSLSIMPG